MSILALIGLVVAIYGAATRNLLLAVVGVLIVALAAGSA